MKRYIVFISLLLVLVTIKCTQVSSVENSPIQVSAEDHYEAGLYALDRGDWEQAALSFNRAIRVDPDYANGYTGAALVLAMKDQPEKAIEYANKAVQLDEKSFDAQLNLGRVLTHIKPDGWYDPAIMSFDAALKIKPQDESALFYKAEALMENRNFEGARALYVNISEKGGRFATKAEQQILYITNYQIASPRTNVGDKLLREQIITRGDMAALLVTEFDIAQTMHRRDPNYAGGNNQQFKAEEQKRLETAGKISDITGYWAEMWIRDAVRYGGMDIFPDNSFRPDEPVQRMNLAMTLQNIIIQATGNNSLYTAFINTPSGYTDVKRTHYAYNAIQMVTEYEIMPMRATNDRFDLDGTISGLDALLALRNLENFLNTAF